ICEKEKELRKPKSMQLWPMKTNPCLWTLPKENWSSLYEYANNNSNIDAILLWYLVVFAYHTVLKQQLRGTRRHAQSLQIPDLFPKLVLSTTNKKLRN
ncbi:Hypothetical predicted protein, partial [Prunus dulcis]